MCSLVSNSFIPGHEGLYYILAILDAFDHKRGLAEGEELERRECKIFASIYMHA